MKIGTNDLWVMGNKDPNTANMRFDFPPFIGGGSKSYAPPFSIKFNLYQYTCVAYGWKGNEE